MRALETCFAACVALAASATASAPSSTLSAEPTIRDYQVYAAVVRALFIERNPRTPMFCQVARESGQIVIENRTGFLANMGADEEEIQRYHHGLVDDLTGAPVDLISRLFQENRASIAVEDRFHLPVTVALVHEREVEALFPGDESRMRRGWPLFYARYPGSQGLLTLSRVVYDEQRALALVYAANQCDDLAGAGLVVLLRREPGKWLVLRSVRLWVS